MDHPVISGALSYATNSVRQTLNLVSFQAVLVCEVMARGLLAASGVPPCHRGAWMGGQRWGEGLVVLGQRFSGQAAPLGVTTSL